MSDRIIIPKPAQKQLDNISKIVIRPIFFWYIFWMSILSILVQSDIQKAFSCTLQEYRFF